MIQVNEYFDGAVKSIGVRNSEGNATVGVMEAGDYEFGTSTIEHMTVTCGELQVELPGATDWKTFRKGELFVVEKGVKFKVKAIGQVAYHCLYL